MNEVNPPKSAESNLFTIRELSPGMLHIIVKDNVEVTLQDMEESLGLLDDFINGNNFVAIIDIRNSFMRVTPDALRFIGSQKGQLKYCKAEAIVVDSLAVSLVMNFYATLIPKQKVSKVFKTFGDAQSWLEEQKHLLQL